ncbi:MAG: M23 family metallopeptidase [Propionibacteriaceae bacterium]|nr:M23 family metallopeptidase [Propionibacteriaceae bacterium]
MSDDTTTVRPAWRSNAAVTTTIIRIKHATPDARPKRRRVGLIAALIPVTVAVALASFGFLTPSSNDAPPPISYGAVDAANDGAENANLGGTLSDAVDDSSTLSNSADAASDALAANTKVQDEITAATQVASDAGSVAETKAIADQATAKGGSGTSRVDYGASDVSGEPVAVPDGAFIYPVTGFVITSPFGWRIHPIYHYKQFHSGVDLAVHCGTPIAASGDGIVTFAGWSGGLGNYVEINHGPLSTGYGHQSKLAVSVGQEVKQGQIIGYVGSTGTSTGCHVHFQAINGDGQFFDPTTLIH